MVSVSMVTGVRHRAEVHLSEENNMSGGSATSGINPETSVRSAQNQPQNHGAEPASEPRRRLRTTSSSQNHVAEAQT